MTASDHQFRETVLLLTSEVATNDVLHAGSKFEVAIESLEDGGGRVAVTDDNPKVPQCGVAPLTR